MGMIISFKFRMLYGVFMLIVFVKFVYGVSIIIVIVYGIGIYLNFFFIFCMLNKFIFLIYLGYLLIGVYGKLLSWIVFYVRNNSNIVLGYKVFMVG